MLKKLIGDAGDFTKMKCAFLIKNLKTGELVADHETEIVPSASLIKIAVAATVMRQVSAGKLSLKQKIPVRAADKVPSSILSLLETGNRYSIHDLLTLMIIQSDNTAANLLIDVAGFAAVNGFLNELDFPHTILQRKMMDFAARQAGRDNLTTAREMARMLEMLYRGELPDREGSSRLIAIMKEQLDTRMMRLYLPDDTAVAHKTGELEGLAHDAGIVYHAKGDYIFVVMIWDAPTSFTARQTIGRISQRVYTYFTENPPV